MNLRLLLVAFLCLALPYLGTAQAPTSWCLPGAEWKYGYAEFSWSGALLVRYTGDTLVGGQTGQVLRRSITRLPFPEPDGAYTLPTIITRVAGDTVLFWHNGRFVPLYCFGAQPGASWTTYATYPTGVCPQYPVQVTVDSVGTQLVGGRLLRWQAVRVSGSHVFWQRRIYEGIGNLGSLQPGGSLCGGTDPGYIGPLLSFRATGFPAVSTKAAGLVVLATAEARAGQGSFTAYPTPTAGQLTVQVPSAMQRAGSLTLRDLAGRRVWQQPVPANQKIDLGCLPKGLYLLILESQDCRPLSCRIVVQ